MPDATTRESLRVSVIIPTYNRADYLREALDSVFAQTLPPWEVIVVDDGSTDDTDQVIRDAGGPIRFYRQAHLGVASARNLGLAHARGDLIAWLDSDDLWEPYFLETVVPILAQDPELDGVYTGIIMIDANRTTLGKSTHVESPADLYDALVRDCFLATPALVVYKRCYDRVGSFDPQFRISEDYDMWLRLAKGHRLIGVPSPLVRIRIHATNTMADVDTLVKARLDLVTKHFGTLEDGASPTTKAAYGFALRSIALKYVEHGEPDKAWLYLEKAVVLHPPILTRLDTFYELACGDQRRGSRGAAVLLDIERNAALVLRWLDALFASAPHAVRAFKADAYGNAYLALAMLSDQAGDWPAARGYVRHAIASHPALLRDTSVVRRLAKLQLGRRLVANLRRVRRYATRS